MAEGIDRKEFARQMRMNAVIEDGVVRVSKELWWQIADMVENSIEVVNGRWIKGKYPGEFTCSWCGMEYSEADPADKPFNYCPECGSKNE